MAQQARSLRKQAAQGASSDANLQAAACPTGCALDYPDPAAQIARAERSEEIRDEATDFARGLPIPAQVCNGDEARYRQQRFIGSYSKGLPHNLHGEVEPDAYCAMTRAVQSFQSGNPNPEQPKLGDVDPARIDRENVPLGFDCDCERSRELVNPQSAFAFDLQGADSHALTQIEAPRFDSNIEAAEILENYWMALARDVPFTEYESQPAGSIIDRAVKSLGGNVFKFYFDDPLQGGPVNRRNLFRGFTPGEKIGPYVSQFLLLDVPYGTQRIPAAIRTVLPEVDYLTNYEDWLEVQNGRNATQSACDGFRLIRNGRDLGRYVQIDEVWQAFMNAALIMLGERDPGGQCNPVGGMGVPFARGLPYRNPAAPFEEEFASVPPGGQTFPRKSQNQIGYATFGIRHVQALLLEVTIRALKTVWYQKWGVHRRLRPEEFGGRVHLHMRGQRNYLINSILTTNTASTSPQYPASGRAVLDAIFAHNKHQNENRRQVSNRDLVDPTKGTNNQPIVTAPDEGTWLLPIAFAEGAPLHPAYGAGHATVAGACATILKAFFATDQLVQISVVPNRDGTELQRYEGTDAAQITVGGEINKLAANISLGRNFAGMHWRSDHTQSLLLGEQVAIRLLQSQTCTFTEADYEFRFHDFRNVEQVIRKPGTCPRLTPFSQQLIAEAEEAAFGRKSKTRRRTGVQRRA